MQDPPKPRDAEAFVYRMGIIRVRSATGHIQPHAAKYSVADILQFLNRGIDGSALICTLDRQI